MPRAIYRPDPEFASEHSVPGAMSFGNAEPAPGYAEYGPERGAFLFTPDDEAQHPGQGAFAGYYVAEHELELLDLPSGAGYAVDVYTMDARAADDEFYVYSGSPSGGFASHEKAVAFVRDNHPDQFQHRQYHVRSRRT